MKKILPALCAAALLCGCTEISRELTEPATQTEVTSESTPPPVTETAETSLSEPEIPEKPRDSKAFFSMFPGADAETGKIADNIRSAEAKLSKDYSCAELSAENVKEVLESGNGDNTLFSFSVPRCDGVLISDSSEGSVYAFGFSDEEGTEYTVVLGDEKTSSVAETDRYISSCTQTDYLAFCSQGENSFLLMPAAAGNAQSGIYGVIPAAKMMGYDMSDTKDFAGIPDSLCIRTAGAEKAEDSLKLFYRLESRFDKDVYYICTNIFLNGESITENVSEDSSWKMEGAGSFTFTDIAISNGDALYFLGSVYDAETGDLICDAPLATVAESMDVIVDSADLEEETDTEETDEQTSDEADEE